MAEHAFCDLEAIRQLGESVSKMVDAFLAEEHSGLSVTSHGFQEITAVPASAPFQEGDDWVKVMQALDRELFGDAEGPNVEAMNQLWTRFNEVMKGTKDRWLISPTEGWSDLETRRVLTDAIRTDDPKAAREILAGWLAEQGFGWRAPLLRHDWMGTWLRTALGTERPREGLASRIMFHDARSINTFSDDEINLLLHVMENPEEWPRLNAFLDDLLKTEKEVADRLDEFHQAMAPFVARYRMTTGQVGKVDVGDIYTWLMPQLNDRERYQVGQILKEYGLPESVDVLEQMMADYEQALEKDIRQQIEQLPRILPDWLHEALQLPAGWIRTSRTLQRAAGLVRPSFLLENFSDILIRTKIAGHSPRGYLQEFMAAYRSRYGALNQPISPDQYRNRVIPPTALDTVLEEYDLYKPRAIMADFERKFTTNPETAALDRTTSPIWQVATLQKLFGTPGRNPLRRAGHLAVDQTARIMRWVNIVAVAQETAGRTIVFGRASQEYMQHALPVFEQRVRQLYQFHGLEGADQMLAIFRQLPKKTVEDARELVLLDHPGYRTLAEQVAETYRTVRQEAIDYGIRESERVHFNFLDRNNADELLGNVFKYHFWATRNLPFYTEELARHYAVMKLWNKTLYYQQRDDSRSPFLGNQIPVLEKAFFFGPGRTYLALWSLISVTGQLDAPDVTYGTPYDKATQVSGSAGLSPLFEIQMVMNLLGVDTRSDPPRYVPISGIPARSLGVDITDPLGLSLAPVRAAGADLPNLNQLVREVRDVTSGRIPYLSRHVDDQTLTGSSSFDHAVWRELIAMSYEQTGRANHPRFIAAMADPTDLLFQEAEHRVRPRRAQTELFNFVSPIRGSVQSETELVLNEAASQEVERTPLQLHDDIRDGTADLWRVYIPRDVREAQIRSGQALMIWLRAQGRYPTDQYLATVLPWYLAYSQWARQQPPGEGGVNQFLSTHPALP